MILIFAAFFTLHAEAAAPDYTGAIYRDGSRIGVVLTPPEKHHFNIEAPMSALLESRKINFSIVTKTKAQIVFEKNDSAIVDNDSISTTVFLCDDAKTFCVKKQLSLSAKPSIAVPAPILPNVPVKKASATATRTEPRIASKKDKEGFWMNAPREALAEAQKTQKPLIIDFYGIWCPPCNQYNETVFPTREFKAAAKNFVLLKMDADAESSWKLKSHFKIGGYPTLLVMKAPNQITESNNFEEIDRIVGFYSTPELVRRMNEAYTNRSERFEDHILSLKANYLDGLQRLIESKWEQKDFSAAIDFANEGLKTRPDDFYFQLVKLQGEAREDSRRFSKKDAIALIQSIHHQRKGQSVDVLMRAQGVLSSNADVFSKDDVKLAIDLLDELASRVNPKTLTVEGYELSLADINAMKVDVADALKDEDMLKRARGETISSYKKLIALQKTESRGLNLELAYWLWNDGREADAKVIYERFIKKYPKEFTFYFAASKMNFELKHFAEAKAQIEKAVELSYGDNHLRSIERQVRILTAVGETKSAIEIGNKVLAKTTDPKNYFIRTDRYITALKKAVDDAKATQK